ncbi:hypothetical protein [Labrenzia sp. CE80]|uniref:hypothetical protein n=1 Tax=Labrenzia sp. CE80 TaxID=1788986 RepID=UPI00129BE9A8|nr:hypothetical protein [Labrenzia sp. CE80]
MDQPTKIVLVDIDIPFIRLVMIMIKFALAAIPAMIAVSLIIAVLMMVLGGLTSSGNFMWMHSGRPY